MAALRLAVRHDRAVSGSQFWAQVVIPEVTRTLPRQVSRSLPLVDATGIGGQPFQRNGAQAIWLALCAAAVGFMAAS